MNFMWSADLPPKPELNATRERSRRKSTRQRRQSIIEAVAPRSSSSESDHADDADQPPTAEHVFGIDAKAVRKRTLERFADEEKRVFGINPLPADFRAELESLLPPVDAEQVVHAEDDAIVVLGNVPRSVAHELVAAICNPMMVQLRMYPHEEAQYGHVIDDAAAAAAEAAKSEAIAEFRSVGDAKRCAEQLGKTTVHGAKLKASAETARVRRTLLDDVRAAWGTHWKRGGANLGPASMLCACRKLAWSGRKKGMSSALVVDEANPDAATSGNQALDVRLKASAANPEQFVVYLSTKEGRIVLATPSHSRAGDRCHVVSEHLSGGRCKRLRISFGESREVAGLKHQMYQKLSLEAVDEPGEALLGVLAAVHASMPRVVLYSEAAELAALALEEADDAERAASKRARDATAAPATVAAPRRRASTASALAALSAARTSLSRHGTYRQSGSTSNLLGLVAPPASPSAPSAPAASMASSSRAPIGTLPTVRIRHLPPPVPSRLLQALKPFRVVSLMVRPDPAVAAGDGGHDSLEGAAPCEAVIRLQSVADAKRMLRYLWQSFPQRDRRTGAPTSSCNRVGGGKWPDIERQPVAIALAAMDDQHGRVFNKGFGGVDRREFGSEADETKAVDELWRLLCDLSATVDGGGTAAAVDMIGRGGRRTRLDPLAPEVWPPEPFGFTFLGNKMHVVRACTSYSHRERSEMHALLPLEVRYEVQARRRLTDERAHEWHRKARQAHLLKQSEKSGRAHEAMIRFTKRGMKTAFATWRVNSARGLSARRITVRRRWNRLLVGVMAEYNRRHGWARMLVALRALSPANENGAVGQRACPALLAASGVLVRSARPEWRQTLLRCAGRMAEDENQAAELGAAIDSLELRPLPPRPVVHDSAHPPHLHARTDEYYAPEHFAWHDVKRHQVRRAAVADEELPWSVDVPKYDPPTYTAPSVVTSAKKGAADGDEPPMLLPARRTFAFAAAAGPIDATVWAESGTALGDVGAPGTEGAMLDEFRSSTSCRTTFDSGPSYTSEMLDDRGVPLNPLGRTGMRGRGALGRWGPNPFVHSVLARRDAEGGGYRMLAVRRRDNERWAIPELRVADVAALLADGAAGDDAWAAWVRDLQRLAYAHADGTASQAAAAEMLAAAAGASTLLCGGYADDPRNTDNAWVETSVWLHRCRAGSALEPKAAGAAVGAAWVTMRDDDLRFRSLHADHREWAEAALQLLAAEDASPAHPRLDADWWASVRLRIELDVVLGVGGDPAAALHQQLREVLQAQVKWRKALARRARLRAIRLEQAQIQARAQHGDRLDAARRRQAMILDAKQRVQGHGAAETEEEYEQAALHAHHRLERKELVAEQEAEVAAAAAADARDRAQFEAMLRKWSFLVQQRFVVLLSAAAEQRSVARVVRPAGAVIGPRRASLQRQATNAVLAVASVAGVPPPTPDELVPWLTKQLVAGGREGRMDAFAALGNLTDDDGLRDQAAFAVVSALSSALIHEVCVCADSRRSDAHDRGKAAVIHALHSELTEQIGRLKSQLDVATRVVTDQTTAMSGETAQAFRRLHNVRHTESQHDAAKAAADTGFRP